MIMGDFRGHMKFKLISADQNMKTKYREVLEKWGIPYLVKTHNSNMTCVPKETYIDIHPRFRFYDYSSDFEEWDEEDYNGHDPNQDFCYIDVDLNKLEELSKDFDDIRLIINFNKKSITLYNDYIE